MKLLNGVELIEMFFIQLKSIQSVYECILYALKPRICLEFDHGFKNFGRLLIIMKRLSSDFWNCLTGEPNQMNHGYTFWEVSKTCRFPQDIRPT